MDKKHRIRIKELSSMMAYILGRGPYEFGLVPDSHGFITFKELLWAFHEEPGWTHVREGSIKEVLLSEERSLFEEFENKIRAVERHWNLNLENPEKFVPKQLFHGIRKKAHPAALEKGLPFQQDRFIVLSSSREMAERLGKRRDRKPVILEINAAKALEQKIDFFRFGDLFLAKELPPEYITGPPVPKDFIRTVEETPHRIQEKPQIFEPGAFLLKAERDPDRSRNIRGKKRKGWKEEARKMRREMN